MKICLTGASSFTGYWIALALSKQGHHVIANFSGDLGSYEGIRLNRTLGLKAAVDCRFNTPFGSEAFLRMVADEAPDILGLHGAEMNNYRSWDFNPLEASRLNTVGIRSLFEGMGARGGYIVATGSVFEPFEGIGDPNCRAFSPYGLSKHLSYEIFRMEADRVGVPLSKFIIPNPFGPLEEPRFTRYLVSEWARGGTPKVGTPDYVRDNIHVDLLASSYAALIRDIANTRVIRMRPSGYIETQGQFARRFSAQMQQRTGRDCPVDFAEQTDFSEPRIRINDMPAVAIVTDWDESAAWDAMAEYYEGIA